MSLPASSFRNAMADASSPRANLGLAGERAALRAYRRAGYRVVARNWRCALGELDLVLARGAQLVFCEVKTRSGVAHGGGFEAVTGRKQRRLRRLAEMFLLEHPHRATQLRFDVASVHVAGPRVDVEIFEDAF